jgi:hypothetical protein
VNPNFVGGAISSPAGSVATDSELFPVSATVNNVFYNQNTGQYLPNSPNSTASYGLGAGITQTYGYTQLLGSLGLPSGLGENRPALTVANGTALQGFVGGIMRTINVDSVTNLGVPFSIINANHSANDVTVQFDPATARMQANFNVGINSVSATNFSSAQYQMGSLSEQNLARGAYIDYDNFGARDGRMWVNTQTGEMAPVSTVNGNATTFTDGALVGIRASDAQSLANGVGPNPPTICSCEYTRWGFWSMRSDRQVSGTNYRDVSNMMLWVAGQRPSASDVPTSGSATYNGHIIANVLNGSNQYIDGANFRNVVNFGTQTGTVTVGGPGIGPGLDGSDYSGTVSFGPDPRNFSGSLTGTVVGRTMTMLGSLFRGTGSPVGEMGGNINVTGPGGYLASGIFVGKQ